MAAPAPAPTFVGRSLSALEELYSALEVAHDAAAELATGPDPVPWALLRATLDRPLSLVYRELLVRHGSMPPAPRHELHPGPVDRADCPDCEAEGAILAELEAERRAPDRPRVWAGGPELVP